MNVDIGPLELYRTKELIKRYLPELPASICDVGGGTGIYSYWLAELGYDVHLVDLIPKHIEIANIRAEANTEVKLKSATIEDARKLHFADNSFNLVLLNGPLYHLVKREDRIKVLNEAYRILKPGGLLICIGITKYAYLIYALNSGYVWDDAYYKKTKDMLERNFDKSSAWYFHHPDELRDEIKNVGFSVLNTLGVLGPGWMSKDFKVKWNTKKGRDRILEIARLTENEPVLDPRTMAIARKEYRP